MQNENSGQEPVRIYPNILGVTRRPPVTDDPRLAAVSALLLLSSFFIGQPVAYVVLPLLFVAGLWKKELLLVILLSVSTIKTLDVLKSFPIDFTVFAFGLVVVLTLFYLPFRKTINKLGLVEITVFGQAILLMLSTAFVSEAESKWLVSGRFVFFNIALFLLPYIILRKRTYQYQLRNFMTAVFLTSIILIGVAFHNLLLSQQTGFLSAFGESYQQLARHLGFGILFILFCLFRKGEKPSYLKITYFCLLIVFIVGIVLAQSRGILFAIILTTAILFMKLFGESKTISKLAVSTLCLIILASAVGYVAIQQSVQSGHNISRLYRPFSSPKRLELYTEAVASFLENPLLGEGTGAFVSAHGLAPHNIFLEAAADYGMVGIILFGLFFASLTYLSFRLVRSIAFSRILVLVPLCFLNILIESLISGSIGSYRSLWLFGSLILLINKFQRRERYVQSLPLLKIQN